MHACVLYLRRNNITLIYWKEKKKNLDVVTTSSPLEDRVLL